MLDDFNIQTDEKFITVKKMINKTEEKTSMAFETDLHQDLGDNTYISSLTSAMVDGKYMPILRMEPIPICKFLNNPKPPAVMKFAIMMLKSFGDVPEQCPIKKGLYSMKDLDFDNNMLIPLMPDGKFLFEMEINLKEGDHMKLISKTTIKATTEGGD